MSLRCRIALLLLAKALVQPVFAWSPTEKHDEGWAGTVEFGAQRIHGNSRSSSAFSAFELRYVNSRFESDLTGEFLYARATFVQFLTDDTGEVQIDEQGLPLLEAVTGVSNQRIAGGLQLRWFWTPRFYQFIQLEQERDKPAGVQNLRRRISGVGYLIWESKDDFLAAELGAGDKQLVYVDEPEALGAIGYIAMRHVRQLDERWRLDAALDADFAGDDPFAELKLAVGVRVSDSVSLKLKHTERRNRRESNPRNPLDSRSDSVTTISLEVALF